MPWTFDLLAALETTAGSDCINPSFDLRNNVTYLCQSET